MFGRRDSEVSAAVQPAEHALQRAFALVEPLIGARIEPAAARRMARRDLSQEIRTICDEALARERIVLNRLESRDLVTRLTESMLAAAPNAPPPTPEHAPDP